MKGVTKIPGIHGKLLHDAKNIEGMTVFYVKTKNQKANYIRVESENGKFFYLDYDKVNTLIPDLLSTGYKVFNSNIVEYMYKSKKAYIELEQLTEEQKKASVRSFIYDKVKEKKEIVKEKKEEIRIKYNSLAKNATVTICDGESLPFKGAQFVNFIYWLWVDSGKPKGIFTLSMDIVSKTVWGEHIDIAERKNYVRVMRVTLIKRLANFGVRADMFKCSGYDINLAEEFLNIVERTEGIVKQLNSFYFFDFTHEYSPETLEYNKKLGSECKDCPMFDIKCKIKFCKVYSDKVKSEKYFFKLDK